MRPERSYAAYLLEQLQVCHFELSEQNDELRESKRALEESRHHYLDLYERAPAAYLTLTPAGVITEVNMAGAQLVGSRSELLERRFESFVAPADYGRYLEMLERAVRTGERQTSALDLYRPDGGLMHAQLDCVAVAAGNTTSIRVIITDLSVRQQTEREVADLAFHDPLTNLPNRRLLLDRLGQAASACHRTAKHGAILSLDLDNFKQLNDTQGHDAGDLLLKQAARRMTASVREVDTVGRMGGDEFVILLQHLSTDPAQAAVQATLVGEKILAALSTPYQLARIEYRSTGSMGITLFSGVREAPENILKRADLALYRAKSAGGGMLQLFDPELEAAFNARATLESELRRALKDRQFLLNYQPQVDDRGCMTGAEALVRWKHPDRGMLRPADFLPLAAEKGLIVDLGEFVLDSACSQLACWAASPQTAHLTLAVNISTPEFCRPDLVSRTLEAIDRTSIDPSRLILEVTESLMLRNLEETVAKVRCLKARGVRFAMDNFGTGCSSLSSLKNLPLDQLKIDASFVNGVLTNAGDAAIVRTIITLGQTLGIEVVAEGVETEAQREVLAIYGCRAYQGNLFGTPLPAQHLRLHEDRPQQQRTG